jgi:hypothetical protein
VLCREFKNNYTIGYFYPLSPAILSSFIKIDTVKETHANPPATGKTEYCIERIRAALKELCWLLAHPPGFV